MSKQPKTLKPEDRDWPGRVRAPVKQVKQIKRPKAKRESANDLIQRGLSERSFI